MTSTDKDKTAGQPRRSSDSRPRPGTGVPEAETTKTDQNDSTGGPAKGHPKPSESWSPIDPGRPTKRD